MMKRATPLRAWRGRLLPVIIALYSAILFGAGYAAGQGVPVARAAQAESSDAALRPLLRIWTLLHEDYFKQPLDDLQLVQGAIDGMLATLGDPHTSYMPPAEFDSLTESLEGEFEGIGAEVDVVDGVLTIVSPIADSPAEAAGLRPGDQVIAVDGVAIADAFTDPMGAITLVRGKAGTPVVLTIRRAGKSFNVTIIRARIPLVSVRGRMLEGEGRDIAYVSIESFGEKTAGELRETLTTLMAQQPAGIVLDLRGNPGGSLESAVRVASHFLGNGLVLTEEWGDGERLDYPIYPNGLATETPLVVLIDGGSASASEIVAGAIQDARRGTLIGTKSFGKGTVQHWHTLDEGDGGVRITVARWLTPKGRWVHGRGLSPEITISITEADIAAERDPQLDGAVRLLHGERVRGDIPPWERYRQ